MLVETDENLKHVLWRGEYMNLFVERSESVVVNYYRIEFKVKLRTCSKLRLLKR